MSRGLSFRKNRDLLLGVLVLTLAGAVAVAASVIGIPQSPCANNRGIIRAFTITADLNGYNNTKSQGGEGPLLTVQTCDTVVVNFANRDIQSHGLAIDFYAVNGLEAQGGDTVRVQFLAYKAGDFRVFCNTLCSIHNYMQHAGLTVGCSPGPNCL